MDKSHSEVTEVTRLVIRARVARGPLLVRVNPGWLKFESAFMPPAEKPGGGGISFSEGLARP